MTRGREIPQDIPAQPRTIQAIESQLLVIDKLAINAAYRVGEPEDATKLHITNRKIAPWRRPRARGLMVGMQTDLTIEQEQTEFTGEIEPQIVTTQSFFRFEQPLIARPRLFFGGVFSRIRDVETDEALEQVQRQFTQATEPQARELSGVLAKLTPGSRFESVGASDTISEKEQHRKVWDKINTSVSRIMHASGGLVEADKDKLNLALPFENRTLRLERNMSTYPETITIALDERIYDDHSLRGTATETFTGTQNTPLHHFHSLQSEAEHVSEPAKNADRGQTTNLFAILDALPNERITAYRYARTGLRNELDRVSQLGRFEQGTGLNYMSGLFRLPHCEVRIYNFADHHELFVDYVTGTDIIDYQSDIRHEFFNIPLHDPVQVNTQHYEDTGRGWEYTLADTQTVNGLTTLLALLPHPGDPETV